MSDEGWAMSRAEIKKNLKANIGICFGIINLKILDCELKMPEFVAVMATPKAIAGMSAIIIVIMIVAVGGLNWMFGLLYLWART